MRLVSIASLAAIGVLLTGCATGAPGSARRICYNTGLQPGTPEFSSCWKGIRDQQFAQDWNMIKDPLAVAAIVAGAVVIAKSGGQANVYAPVRPAEPDETRRPATPRTIEPIINTHPMQMPSNGTPAASGYSQPVRPSASAPSGDITPHMCANGTNVVGTCTMAPDGSFVGGQPRMAPDGSYVTGQPRMAPDGTFVGGNGKMTMCPNGSYVVGNTCRLMPNGQYVGQ